MEDGGWVQRKVKEDQGGRVKKKIISRKYLLTRSGKNYE